MVTVISKTASSERTGMPPSDAVIVTVVVPASPGPGVPEIVDVPSRLSTRAAQIGSVPESVNDGIVVSGSVAATTIVSSASSGVVCAPGLMMTVDGSCC